MPINDKRDLNSWYNSIPTRYQNEMAKPDKFTEALLSMDVFDIDKLDNEYIRPDGSVVAKIPKIGNRIKRWESGEEYGDEYVDLVIGRVYDPETQQTQDERVTIGTVISNLPGLMYANERYHDYFDRNGRLYNDPMKEPESVTDEPDEAPTEVEEDKYEEGNGTDGACPEVSQRLKERVAEELKEKNEIRLGGTTLVRLPQIPGIRILPPNQQGFSQVEYRYDQWYDPIKQQSRNRKRIIGKVSDEYPGAMIPNDRYRQIFNIETGLTWKEEAKQDGIEIEKFMQELRQNVEKRKKKEEEERRQREEDERLKKLYGEDSAEVQEAASRSLGKMFSELHDQYDAEDRQDYIDLGIEDEYDKEDSSQGPEAGGGDTESQSSDMEELISKENGNEANRETDGAKERGKEDLQDLYNQVSKEKERTAILMRILESVTKTIGNQAKKHPDHIINAYKARKINEILIELRVKYQGSGYEDLLELIQEPEEVEQNGQRFLAGMTYSDAEVLLCHYATIIEHIRLGRN